MKLMGFVLSEEQESIVLSPSDKDLIIIARAGTGKTTVLMMLAKYLYPDNNNYIIAFNVSIKDEINKKLKELGLEHNAKGQTLHSLGLAIISYNWNHRIEIRNDILKRKIEKYFEENHYELKQRLDADLYLSKYEFVMNLSEYLNIVRMFYNQNPLKIKAIMNKYFKPFNTKYNSFIPDAMAIMKKHYSGEIKHIDYLDMLFIPVYKKMKFKNVTNLFLDEAQDHGELAHRLIKLVNPTRMVLVGDNRQAIMTFAGAIPQSLLKARQTVLRPGFNELSLTLCRRCPRKVIELAQEYVPDIMCGVDLEGQVTNIHKFRVKDLVINTEGDSMLLFRNNIQAIREFFDNSEYEKIAYLKNIELYNDIKWKINSAKEFTIESVSEKRNEAVIDAEALVATIGMEKDQALRYIEKIKEPWSMALKAMLKSGDRINNRKKFMGWLKSLFYKNDKRVTFSTVHKSKGLESKVVFLFKEKLFKVDRDGVPEPIGYDIENDNLIYVGITRSKEKLYIVD